MNQTNLMESKKLIEGYKNKAVGEQRQRVIPSKFIGVQTDRKELFEKHYGNSLYIMGNVGVGKTVFAASYAKRFIKENLKIVYYEVGEYSVRPAQILWYSYPRLVMQLKSRFSDGSENPYITAERIADYNGLVVIDDLGAEKHTEFIKEVTYCIVNQRELDGALTVITSNLSLEELEPRIASRIAGMCNVLKLTGKDRRLEC